MSGRPARIWLEDSQEKVRWANSEASVLRMVALIFNSEWILRVGGRGGYYECTGKSSGGRPGYFNREDIRRG